MQYQGGKSQRAKDIAGFINSIDSQVYIEPFIGGGSVMAKVEKKYRYGSDIHKDLILLWQAVLSGWIPPDSISESEYKNLKNQEPSALRGFAGFAGSWGGKFFGGYARSSQGQDYIGGSKNSILRKVKTMQGVQVGHCCYKDWTPYINPGSIIYCDPPYFGTAAYAETPDFNHRQFWNWCDRMSEQNHVFVSEQTCFSDKFESVCDTSRAGYGFEGLGKVISKDNLFYRGPK